jgi:hypothetical protein
LQGTQLFFTLKTKQHNKEIMPGEKRRAKRALQREEAEKRQQHTKLLAPKQRLKALDERLGKGIGAMKERARLQLMLEA